MPQPNITIEFVLFALYNIPETVVIDSFFVASGGSNRNQERRSRFLAKNHIRILMLLEFGAKNFFSFKEWIVLSFKLNDNVPSGVSKGLKNSFALCLKGANASGKTNAIKIFSFLSYFCADSFSGKPDDEILVDTFFDDPSPTDFYVEFEIDNVLYEYELSLTKKGVISEKIYKTESRKTLVLHRDNDKLLVHSLFGKDQIIPVVRNNASIISTANQYTIKEIEPFYKFFFNASGNVNRFGLAKAANPAFTATSEFYYKNPEYLKFIELYLKKFDTGISSIRINPYESDKGKLYLPMFGHEVKGELKFLPYGSQSGGTKELFSILRDYKAVLETGGVLLLDEFDMNLHPDMLPHLVGLFDNKETNPKGAQLIFSTHNTDIIDEMGKYRTYLLNKDDGESFCYRLDELDSTLVRNDRPIVPLYKAKRLGGYPRIE
jgi:AAA15 family ATPase/GTPase